MPLHVLIFLILIGPAVAEASSAGNSGGNGASQQPTQRPETLILERNLRPKGANPYELPAGIEVVKSVEVTTTGVKLVHADGHALEVSKSGAVAIDILKNGLAPVGDDLFRDVIAGAFIVSASCESVNHAIRDVDAYPKFFQSDKELYCHTWYEKCAKLDLSKHPADAAAMATNQQEVSAELKKMGFGVDEPESNLIELELLIGKCNMFVKLLVEPTLRTTCYRVRRPVKSDAPAVNGAQGELVAILNENTLSKPDERGGAQRQNVTWSIEPMASGETLVRYVYAQEQLNPKASMVKIDRWEMSIKNVSEYLSGIRLMALAIEQGKK